MCLLLHVCMGTVYTDAITVHVGSPAVQDSPCLSPASSAITQRVSLPCWKSLRACRKRSDVPSGDSLCEGIVSHRKPYGSQFLVLPHLRPGEGESKDAELQSPPGAGLKDLLGLFHCSVGPVGWVVH